MALKNTKATQHLPINKSSAYSDPVTCTESHFQELKNTFKARSHQRGIECERKVAHWLSQNGFQFLKSRWRTPFAEVDLVFRRSNEIFLIEVKSLGRLDFSLARVRPRQKQRLLRARQWVEGRFDRPVALAFAYVLANGKILLLNLSGEELNWS